MPALTPRAVTHALLAAIDAGGGRATLAAESHGNPRKLIVRQGAGAASVWAYVWTLTPGGRPQLPDEYRIQMTGVEPPLQVNERGVTVLLGYEPGRRLFAGFDIESHRTFTEGSSSVQVPISLVERAAVDGLSLGEKSNDEIAVGIRPDNLLLYTEIAASLHREGQIESSRAPLEKVARADAITETDLEPLTLERRRVVREINRLARDSRFRGRVMTAYEHRCAVTGSSMGLAEAAHILPVGNPGSTDDVTNGIALAPTIHRAFDDGLLYLDENLVVHLNDQRAKELEDELMADGLDELRAVVGRVCRPRDPANQPNPGMIASANRSRRIPGW